MSPRERLFAVTSPTAVSRETTLKPVMAVPNKPIRSTTEAIACAEVPLGDSAPTAVPGVDHRQLDDHPRRFQVGVGGLGKLKPGFFLLTLRRTAHVHHRIR